MLPEKTQEKHSWRFVPLNRYEINNLSKMRTPKLANLVTPVKKKPFLDSFKILHGITEESKLCQLSYKRKISEYKIIGQDYIPEQEEWNAQLRK